MDFNIFKKAVAKQFERMKSNELFRTDVDKDEMWATYLSSFPAGSDPIYKERTEHDCNCCKQFIRSIGNVVAMIDGKLESIWDVNAGDVNYQAVTDALSALVKSKPISDQFLHYERIAGTDKNFQDILDGEQKGVKTWQHFFVNIPPAYVKPAADIATILGNSRSTQGVFYRALTELTDDAVDTVLDLISQNSLYRGEEHKYAVTEFKKVKQKFNMIPKAEDGSYTNMHAVFAWTNMKLLHGAVTNIRGSAIGTLLVNLSKDVELEDAVKMFVTSVMAPSNYKRPTALVSKSMIENAKKTIEKLGLVSALERRYACLDDITINNILHANRDARKVMNGDVFSEMAESVSGKTKKLDKVEEVGIEKFIADILPRADSIEIMMENRHSSNLMSLIAPVDPTAANLFKWNNNFSWSYNGDVADSIKERVKQAGGNVTGDVCCRLAWFNHDDLDLHMIEPDGYEIYFSNRSRMSPCGGQLDVDMNAGRGTTRTPVENIVYASKRTMREGRYQLRVNNWAQRESSNVGFEVEVDFEGTVHRFEHAKAVRNGETITVVEFEYSRANGMKIIRGIPSSTSVKDVWGVKTNTFQKVNVLMLSPNYWDDQGSGNKHYFFMLEGCVNEGQARGFFNEFLKEELNPHRKVIEIVGSKMKTTESEKQLSGLGFSSTQRNTVLCKVNGNVSRVVKIVF